LIDALNSLERLAANAKRRVGVIFDEFQHLLKLGGAGIEGQLRAAVQTHRHVGYVFAGSQTTLISDMVTNHARPFYRMGESIFIGAIPREEFLPYLAAAADADGIQLLSRPILKRYDLSAGTMQKALLALENLAVLRREYRETEVRYRFEDPFFKAWILVSTVASHRP
jgi:AAA+ ATPase superfamily predicted ATPase